MKRIAAKFIPQAWINDYACDIDDVRKFDVTDQVLAMPREKALAIRDDQYESDNLWHDNPSSLEVDWTGPFRIEVEDAIAEYFGIDANA